MATVQSVIISAMRELEIAAAGEPVDGEDLFLGLECFNSFVDAMKVVRVDIWELVRSTFAMTASTVSYALGPSAVWDTGASSSRPQWIVRAGFIPTGQTLELPVRVFTDEEWASVELKTLTSTITYAIWYQTGVPNGTVFVHPILTTTGTMVLYLPQAMEEVAEDDNGLAVTLVVPPGYRRMLKTNLALEMADAFGVTPSDNLKKKANDSLRAVQKANIKAAILPIPSGLRRSRRFNILTGY